MGNYQSHRRAAQGGEARVLVWISATWCLIALPEELVLAAGGSRSRGLVVPGAAQTLPGSRGSRAPAWCRARR